MRIWFFASTLRCGRKLRVINNCARNGLDVIWKVLALIPIVVEADEHVAITLLLENSGSHATAAAVRFDHQDSAAR